MNGAINGTATVGKICHNETQSLSKKLELLGKPKKHNKVSDQDLVMLHVIQNIALQIFIIQIYSKDSR